MQRNGRLEQIKNKPELKSKIWILFKGTMKMENWQKGKRIVVVGGGPGGISTALALHQKGYDVRVYEKQPQPKAIGGAVLLSVPVLAILRSYGIDVSNFGSYTVTHFCNKKGKSRVKLPFNPKIEKCMGIKGWHYGVLRSSAFKHMLDLVPEGMIYSDHEFDHYEERQDGVTVYFKNGETVEADILVGADGVRSGVSRQAFGDPQLFHVGIRLWLAWTDFVEGIPPNYGFVSHDNKYQASFFPMLHDGKPGFEWWVVEPANEGDPVPKDPIAYLSNILKDWADPMPRFPALTNPETQLFRWEIYNRPSLKKWSTAGRVVCLGDAVHPVSPYAAYGMGMAIEDGYFLAKFLAGDALESVHVIQNAFLQFEKQRVDYVNHQVEFARKLGKIFHRVPKPLAKVRDFIFDHTRFLEKNLVKGYLQSAEMETLSLKELHINQI